MDIKARIEEFIIEELCPARGIELDYIDEDEPLIVTGIVDSLAMMQILSFVDEELEIDISGEEIKLENFKNLKTICNYIKSLENG